MTLDSFVPIGTLVSAARRNGTIVEKIWLGDRWANVTNETLAEAGRLMAMHPAAVLALDDDEAQRPSPTPDPPKEPEPRPPILHEDITLDGWRERIKRMSRPVI